MYTSEDATLIFRLINELYYSKLSPEDARFLKHREELISFFSKTMNSKKKKN